MIKFFRKIRQGLLTENKFSKYLIYAIGEIVLVVIGILIALQINNWNEQKKLNLKEQGLIKELNLDFVSNKIQLDTLVNVSNRAIRYCDQFLDRLNQVETNNLDINELDQKLIDSIKYYFEETFQNWTFNPKNGTVNAIINSTNLDIIKNDSLRRAIISWNDVLGDYLEDENRNTDLYQKHNDWLSNTFDLTKRPIKSEFYTIISSKENKNFVVLRRNTLRNLLKAVKDEGVIDLVETIVTLTEKEIKK